MSDVEEALLALAREEVRKGAVEAVKRAQGDHPYTDQTHMLTDTTVAADEPEGATVGTAQDYGSHVEEWARRTGRGGWFYVRVREGLETVGVSDFDPAFDTQPTR